jgi:hypothetical protein
VCGLRAPCPSPPPPPAPKCVVRGATRFGVSCPLPRTVASSITLLTLDRCCMSRLQAADMPDTLRMLDISRCARLTHFSGDITQKPLESMRIQSCRLLSLIPLNHPPTLEVFDIMDCPRIKRVPEHIGSRLVFFSVVHCEGVRQKLFIPSTVRTCFLSPVLARKARADNATRDAIIEIA